MVMSVMRVTTSYLTSSTSAHHQHDEREDEEQHASEKEQVQDGTVVHGRFEAHELQHHAFVERLLVLLLLSVADVVRYESRLTVVGANAYERHRLEIARLGIVVRLSREARHLLLERLTHVVEHRSQTIEH